MIAITQEKDSLSGALLLGNFCFFISIHLLAFVPPPYEAYIKTSSTAALYVKLAHTVRGALCAAICSFRSTLKWGLQPAPPAF